MKNLLFLLPLLLLLTSCDDDEVQPATPLTEAEAALAADRVQLLLAGQSTLQRGYEETQVEARQQDGLSNNVSGENDPTARPKGLTCPGVEFTSDPDTFFPAVLRLNYDECDGPGAVDLGGIITTTFNGLLISPGTEVSIDFADFSVNEYTLSGSYTESNDSLDAQGRQTFSKLVGETELLRNDTSLFIYRQDGISYQVAGQQTNFFNAGLGGIFDDRFNEEFDAGGNFADGSAYAITTTVPVETAFGCDYYTSGTLTYELELLDNVPAVLDFGDGSCDNQATLTIGEFSFLVLLD